MCSRIPENVPGKDEEWQISGYHFGSEGSKQEARSRAPSG